VRAYGYCESKSLVVESSLVDISKDLGDCETTRPLDRAEPPGGTRQPRCRRRLPSCGPIENERPEAPHQASLGRSANSRVHRTRKSTNAGEAHMRRLERNSAAPALGVVGKCSPDRRIHRLPVPSTRQPRYDSTNELHRFGRSPSQRDQTLGELCTAQIDISTWSLREARCLGCAGELGEFPTAYFERPSAPRATGVMRTNTALSAIVNASSECLLFAPWLSSYPFFQAFSE
jgi:hypothetical protein